MEPARRPDNRREERLSVSLPVRVLGYDPDGAVWQELTETDDLSAGGTSFRVKRPVFKGQVLRLALPMPKRLRRFDPEEPAYRVYGLVREAVLEGGICRVGVMFYGKEPPAGYEQNPSARFRLPSDLDEVRPAAPRAYREQEAEKPDPYGRRESERFDIFVDFFMELVDEWGAVLQEERTVAENISKGGARLLTSRDLAKGDVIVLHEVGGSFETRAEIKELNVGKDGIRRLNVRFLDGRSPDHLVRRR
jgi:hypothetical protein